jgi:hypothetical protein
MEQWDATSLTSFLSFLPLQLSSFVPRDHPRNYPSSKMKLGR